MKVLVTGAVGFIGRNLTIELKNRGFKDIMLYDIGLNEDKLDDFCSRADFVFHLAGINRPDNDEDFMEGNAGLTSEILGLLEKHENKCPVLFSSSIQAENDSPYGKSKRVAEEELFTYAKRTGSDVLVYRLPNIFGKWSRPNYNSAVATFCYNISRGMGITVTDPEKELMLVYIDDVVDEMIGAVNGRGTKNEGFYEVETTYKATLRYIVDLLYSFKKGRETKYIPEIDDDFIKKLYSTYLSFLDEEDFSYSLKTHKDQRGSFAEFLRSSKSGQVSINVTAPGTAKGDHWHHTKIEKFLVVSGTGIISFREPGKEKIIRYNVSESELKVVDIPAGYAHKIENIGDKDMVTVIWSSECFEPENQDTYPMEV